MNAHRIPGQFILMSVVIPALCAFINKDLYISQDNFVGCCGMDGCLLYIKKGCWVNSHSHFAPFWVFSHFFPPFLFYQFCFFLLHCSFSHFTSFLFSIPFLVFLCSMVQKYYYSQQLWTFMVFCKSKTYQINNKVPAKTILQSNHKYSH